MGLRSEFTICHLQPLEVCVLVVIMCTIRRKLYHSTAVVAVDDEVSTAGSWAFCLAFSFIFSIAQTSAASCRYFLSFFAFMFYFFGFV
jgi:hypothetical protein